MATDLRIALEGKLEQVEQATLRWAGALENLRDSEWDRRRGWAALAIESEGELEAVRALEQKASTMHSAEGTATAGRYHAARETTERLLRGRLSAFGDSCACSPASCARQLAEHLPLQCARVFTRPVLLMHALIVAGAAVALSFVHPEALMLLTGALGLALLSVRVHARVTVTQKVLAVNGFALPFERIQSATLCQRGTGYLLVVLERGGPSHSWRFGLPLTDVMEILASEGVRVTSCPVAPVFKEPEPESKSELDWFDRYLGGRW